MISIGVTYIESNEEVTEEANYRYKQHLVCSCGEHTAGTYLDRLDIPTRNVCPVCDNKTFYKRNDIPHDVRTLRPTFFDIEDSTQGFKFSMSNVSFIYHSPSEEQEESMTLIQTNLIRSVEFNLVKRELKVYKNGKIEFDYANSEYLTNGIFTRESPQPIKRIDNYVTKNITGSKVFEILNLQNADMYIYNSGGYAHEMIHDLCRMLNKPDSELDEEYNRSHKHTKYNVINIIANEFGGAEYLFNVSTKKRNLSRHYIEYVGEFNFNTTKPHDMLRTPKWAYKLLKSNKDVMLQANSTVGEVVIGLSVIRTEKMKSLLELGLSNPNFYKIITSHYYMTELQELIIERNYDAKTLYDYLFNQLPIAQGITSPREAIKLLKDYVNMAILVEGSYDKYPNSLKREHDVYVVLYNAKKKDYDEKRLAESLERRKEWEYAYKGMSIILPTNSSDIVDEGVSLHHCVGSYTNQVVQGRTNILFLRNNKDLDKSLVTVEVNNKGKLVQARGLFNRSLQDNEVKFIDKWKEVKSIY